MNSWNHKAVFQLNNTGNENIQSHHGAILAVNWNHYHNHGNCYVFERKLQQLGSLLCVCFHGFWNLSDETLYEKTHGKTPSIFKRQGAEITVHQSIMWFRMIFNQLAR